MWLSTVAHVALSQWRGVVNLRDIRRCLTLPRSDPINCAGTLMSEEVLKLLIKRVPKAKPAALSGYTRYKVKGQVFPAIVPATSTSKVNGKVGSIT